MLLSSSKPDQTDADESAASAVQATPLVWIWITLVAGLAFMILQTYIATQAPTLGITLAPGEGDNGVKVLEVDPQLPAGLAGLEINDVIVAVSGTSQRIPLRNYLTMNDPDMAGDYVTINAFRRDVRNLSRLMLEGPVNLILADGRQLQVSARTSRPLGSFPGWYWAISVMGIIALIIGVALKAHTPDDSNTSVIMVAAIGFWVTAWSWPLYGTKEMGAPLHDYVGALESINHLGFVLMIGAAMALLWQYPVRLGPGRILPLLLGIGTLIWGIVSFQVFEFPFHAFYLPLFCLPLIVSAIFAAMQWRQSQDRPLEKASLRWLLMTMFGSTCGAFAFYVVPPLYGAEPITSPWASQLILLIFFLGLAMGAARYRLFDVERWWLNTWLWFGMGAAIILIDVALISFLQWGAAGSTAVAVVVVAWIYFPLRQYVWGRVAHGPDRSPWQIMPEIASRFALPLSASEVATELGSLFETIFDTPDVIVLPTPVQNEKPRLTHHGLNLVIPAPQGAGQVLLSGKHRGRKLFDTSDIDYAQSVVKLVDQFVVLTREHESAERKERERIMRDLHDDVGARLLSLVHGTHDPQVREEASDLLQTLRTSVIPLHSRQTTPLAEALDKWRAELEQRLGRARAKLQWEQNISYATELRARHYVNITRILRELLTNALKHAHPETVWITANSTNTELSIRLQHNGAITDPEIWTSGRGQHNLATRAKEIQGTVQYRVIGKEPDKRLEALLVVKL